MFTSESVSDFAMLLVSIIYVQTKFLRNWLKGFTCDLEKSYLILLDKLQTLHSYSAML